MAAPTGAPKWSGGHTWKQTSQFGTALPILFLCSVPVWHAKGCQQVICKAAPGHTLAVGGPFFGQVGSWGIRFLGQQKGGTIERYALRRPNALPCAKGLR